tara:strand:- start:1331 stop:2302 length:972 start_codon:yes stop_codon:yes gene_type:complete
MKIEDENNRILSPKNQLFLYGYSKYFQFFYKLFQLKRLPNTILLSGPKGSGKATFAYHFINYILSKQEQNNYGVDNFSINPENKSYKLVCDNTHPNFFLLDNNILDEQIKIEKVRNLIKYINKSTFSSNIKLLMIDNVESLNINSSNALLKVLEEPSKDTFIFIVHNSKSSILNTIKSRSIEFKFLLNKKEKLKIFNDLIKQYNINVESNTFDEYLSFETPGNILNYLNILNENKISVTNNDQSSIFDLLDCYKQKKDPKILFYISFLIEVFYNKLSLKNKRNLNFYFMKKSKAVNQIRDFKKFNLDRNNIFITLSEMIKNET